MRKVRVRLIGRQKHDAAFVFDELHVFLLSHHYDTLSQTLQHSGGEALQPLTISQDGIVSISQVNQII